MKLYRITIIDPVAEAFAGAPAAFKTNAPRSRTVVPEVHYADAIEIILAGTKPPFQLNVELAGEIDDAYIIKG